MLFHTYKILRLSLKYYLTISIEKSTKIETQSKDDKNWNIWKPNYVLILQEFHIYYDISSPQQFYNILNVLLPLKAFQTYEEK